MRKGLWEELSAWIEEKLVAQPEHSLAAFLDRPFPEDDGLLFDVAGVEDLSPGAGVAFFVEFEDSDEEPDLWEDASSGKTPKAKPEPDTAGSAPLQAPNAAKPREEPPADRPYKPKIRGKKPQSLHYSVVEKAPRPKAEPAGFDPLRGRVVTEEGFPEAVLRLIGEKNMTDPQCYNRANISRAVFNKLKQSALNPAKHTYRPSKTTALALAVALELSLDETNDLLKKAGFALSRSDKGDVIVEYFLVNRMYDIFEINEALFRFDQPLLGSL
jgi:hypothetical protein